MLGRPEGLPPGTLQRRTCGGGASLPRTRLLNRKSLLTGISTGNSLDLGASGEILGLNIAGFQPFRGDSLLTHNRDFLRLNREFLGGNREPQRTEISASGRPELVRRRSKQLRPRRLKDSSLTPTCRGVAGSAESPAQLRRHAPAAIAPAVATPAAAIPPAMHAHVSRLASNLTLPRHSSGEAHRGERRETSERRCTNAAGVTPPTC